MSKIKKIKIQNFRGVKAALQFPFLNGTNFTSLLIYGKNGTGKSSISDAWEWWYSSKIEHLAREDAGERVYTHLGSDGKDCYIEIESDDLGIVKYQFNSNRITQPIATGNNSELKAKMPHPCHLRYRDLQKFVYSTKFEKYEYLAKYMGFSTALSVPNGMKKHLNTINSLAQHQAKNIASKIPEIKKIIGEEKEISEDKILIYLSEICSRHNITPITKFTEIALVVDELQKLIGDNPRIKELAEWKEIKALINRLYPILSLKEDAAQLENLFRSIKLNEAGLTNTYKIGLYKNALQILNSPSEKNICPLCDQMFEGDLVSHIDEKHIKLKELSGNIEKLKEIQTRVVKNLESILTRSEGINNFTSENVTKRLKELFEIAIKFQEDIPHLIESLSKDLLSTENLEISGVRTVTQIEKIIENEKELKEIIEENINNLDTDEARKMLSEDFVNLNELASSFFYYIVSSKKLLFLNESIQSYEFILNNYNDWLKDQIQTIFDSISRDIVDHFNILEDNHPYIQNPVIKLVEGRDKAIELEIEFCGEKLSPAYKVISESQINSFGLAVFLAAIKHFNSECKFMILDDVINSFDAYKRPRVIDLIEEKFSDYQFLILTHDIIWFEQVARKFNRWNKLRFYGWDFENGPKLEAAKNWFERIEDDIIKDRGREAGQTLAGYLEWFLQVLNQNFFPRLNLELLINMS